MLLKPLKLNFDLKSSAYFTDERLAKLNKAIQQAEKTTSGEIRLYVEDRCKEDVLDRASFLFAELKMHKTALRNGVLFYLAMEDKKFAILGDAGINAKVSEGFWEEIKNEMASAFSQSEFAAGLENGILMAGQALSKNFPYQKGDVNELSDDIIIK